MRNKTVGLYFGSFNPIHIGHLAIADYMLHFSEMDELWFVISPQNPYKQQKSLLAEHHRYAMVQLAIEDFAGMKASTAEFKLPKPSYTYLTVAHLQSKYPDIKFSLIMGMDNLAHFHRWKNAKNIAETCGIFVYPRPNCQEGEMLCNPNVTIVDAPLMEISSSMLRQSIQKGKLLKAFFPPKVAQYIEEMHFYS